MASEIRDDVASAYADTVGKRFDRYVERVNTRVRQAGGGQGIADDIIAIMREQALEAFALGRSSNRTQPAKN